jgi:hypothetical protein
VINLIVSILLGWLILKLLWPRAPLLIEPPPPQIVIHLHRPVIVLDRAAGNWRWGMNVT